MILVKYITYRYIGNKVEEQEKRENWILESLAPIFSFNGDDSTRFEISPSNRKGTHFHNGPLGFQIIDFF